MKNTMILLVLTAMLTATPSPADESDRARCLDLEGRTMSLERAAREIATIKGFECLLALEWVADDRHRVTKVWAGYDPERGQGKAVAVSMEDRQRYLLGRSTIHNHPGMTPFLSDGDLKMGYAWEAPLTCVTWRTGIGRIGLTHLDCLGGDELLPELFERGWTMENLVAEARSALDEEGGGR